MKIRAPFRYWGSKVRMAPWIVERLPAHEHFIEACAGSAAILAVKEPALAETLNDTYGEVVNFFTVLRDPQTAAELIDLVTFTPYSREEFIAAFSVVEPRSPVVQAWAFFMRMQMAVVPGRTGWSYSVGGATSRKANKAGRWSTMPELLQLCHTRFARVNIEQLDIMDLFKRYDHPTTLFFIDPPYTDEARPNSTGASSGYEHDQFDHHAMLDWMFLTEVESSFAVTHYPDELYDSLPWSETHDYVSHRNIANRGEGSGRSEAVERLYILERR